MLLDHYMTEALGGFAPHFSAFSISAHRELSRNISKPKPVIDTIAHYIHSDRAKEVNPDKARLMEMIPSA